MPDPLFDRARAALGELLRLIEERRASEDELATSATRDDKSARDKEEQELATLAENQARELADLDAASRKEVKTLSARLAAEETAAQSAIADERRRLEAEEREGRAHLDGVLKDAQWMADSVAEGERKELQEQLQAVRREVKSGEERGETLWTNVEPLLARVELEREDVELEEAVRKTKSEAPANFETSLIQADELRQEMEQSLLLRWMGWPRTVVVALMVWAASSLPALWLKPAFIWPLGGILVAVLAALGSRTLFHALARRRFLALGEQFARALHEARQRAADLLRQAETDAAARRTAVHNKCIDERRKAQAVYKPLLDELLARVQARRDALERQIETTFPVMRKRAKQSLESARLRHKETQADFLALQAKELRDAETAHAERLRNLGQSRRRQAQAQLERWESGAAALLATFTELQQIASNSETPAAAPSPSLPFGTITIDPAQLAGETDAKKLAPLPAHPIQLPAFLPFPRLGGLLLQAFGQGRTVAVHALQALMLRFLTSLPPGKVRFTILDPVGLGENFAAFMHLADHDETLVSSRIWTEPAHIDKQLTDLTVHMENVIQKYLRSQFRSIEDYNAQAGEVAEPYRVLVVANFPCNFTPQAARRLVSIVQSGSSCGVYALISLDTRQPLPQGFQVEDLEQLCLNLFWRTEHFEWGDPELDRYPLALEMPPNTEQVIETVRRVGALSRDASNVRVPFSFIAPADEDIWKGDSRRGITVPLGRSGAVRQLALQLGQGTSQHVLVAGKTGSGKSTLWHALIANLALIYRPAEVTLYLIGTVD